jgi:pimeloyl-ACP methyl ester carboxylesterase
MTVAAAADVEADVAGVETEHLKGHEGPRRAIQEMRKPTLVLLPGLDGTGDLFDPFIAANGSALDTLVFRYPPNEALDYADIEALVRNGLPADKPVVVVGESFSGPIAASLAANPPANLRGVVLCCTFVTNPHPWLSLFKHLSALANPKRVPLPITAQLLMGQHSTPELCTSLAAALAKVSPSALQARLRAILAVNVSTELGAAKVPVLYVQALQDRLVPAAASRKVLDALPSMQIARIDGPHFLLQTHPVEAAKTVSNFVRALENRGEAPD